MDKNFLLNVKVARANKELTQVDVANYLGISRRSYIAFEHGDNDFRTHERLVKLCEYLDLEIPKEKKKSKKRGKKMGNLLSAYKTTEKSKTEYVFGVFRNYNLLVGQDEEHGCIYENLDELEIIFKNGRDAQKYADEQNEEECARSSGFEVFYHVERWEVN